MEPDEAIHLCRMLRAGARNRLKELEYEDNEEEYEYYHDVRNRMNAILLTLEVQRRDRNDG